MFENLKKKIAVYLVEREYLRKKISPVAFNEFTKKALNYLVIVPENDEDFKNSFLVIRYLIQKGKNVTLFISEHKYSLVPEKEKFKLLSFSLQQLTKLRLPNSILKEKLEKRNFDVILNLNRTG